MKRYSPILILFLSHIAFAASEHGAAHGGIPTKTVIYQILNLTLLIGGMIYFLREPTRKYFQDRRAEFLNAAQKAEAARKAAEQERMEIQVRLSKLESTADESISRARTEAADMKKQLIAEAEALSKRIREEAEIAAKFEVERAKNQLRENLIKESLEVAKVQLSSKLTEDDHKRLQSEFISNIQGVQR
jgi:F-type H+-transporting ATPase subunit b